MAEDSCSPDEDLKDRPGGLYEDPWAINILDDMRHLSIQVLCTAGSGSAAITAVAPLERIKILMQTSISPPQSRTDVMKSIMKEGGSWTSYYRGNGANILRLVPEVGFKFMMHDQHKALFAPADGSPPGLYERLAAGASTGTLKTLLFYPLDLARVRITADMTPSSHRAYPTYGSCFSGTFQREGIRGLYRGLLVSMVGVVPFLTLSLATYDELKARLPEDRVSKSSWWFPLLKMGCGATAAVVAQTVTYPLDTLRRRMQVSGAQGRQYGSHPPPFYRGALHCLREAAGAREGFAASLYRGCLVNMLRTVPGAAVQFVAYDLIKTGITYVDPTVGVQSPL